MSTIELNVPDIGDATDVDVIEILVAVGDEIEAEQSLITVESDKASMEIPAEQGGVVEAILVKLGDKVSQGTPIVRVRASEEAAAPVEAAGAAAPVAEPAPEADPAPAPVAPVAAAAPAPATTRTPDLECDLMVLGAGPGGYSAAFRAADLGLKVVLVERYETLGGVCLNVGCIPSKALLHTAGVLEAARGLASQGIVFGDPQIKLDALRAHKEKVVGRLTTGLAGMARARKVQVLTGMGAFLDAHHLAITRASGEQQVLRFASAIIAAGSQSIQLPFLPDDARIVDATGALALPKIPERMLIVGGGIIGLEMATVYSALGARIDVVEMQTGLMPGCDRDLVKVWQRKNAHRFDHIMLETRTTGAEVLKNGLRFQFEGKNAPSEDRVYDLVLQAAGRKPNGALIGAEKAGVEVDERGYIPVDTQMRTNVAHIHAIGDIVGQPMLAHKAVHEAHVAAEVIAGQKSVFDARVIPSVAYTDPEIAWVGLTEEQARKENIDIFTGVFPWAASGRAIANTRDEGFTKLIFDASNQRILGAGIVGTGAGDLISEAALAIEMGADALDIAGTIHPHPTLGETLAMAAQAALGTCTDLPPSKRN